MKTSYSKNGITMLCAVVYFISYFSRKDFAAVMAAMLSQNVLDKSTAGLIGNDAFRLLRYRPACQRLSR